MKALSLITFATVFLLSAALPEGKGKGQHSSLVESDSHNHGESLQRRKPPGKPPGPALMTDNQYQDVSFLNQLSDEGSKNIYLTSDKNKKHAHLDSHDNGKKHKNLASGFYGGVNGEETQRERSGGLRSEFNSP